ncbi:MAG: hypothetical protein M3121_02070 [Chloroflexota bacterium]|nr:hypothetical protein [Chloroflexota bacterium]
MSQQPRPRRPGRSGVASDKPVANVDTEVAVDSQTTDPDELLARRPPLLAYSLVVAMIVMLLVCALTIYIAAP